MNLFRKIFKKPFRYDYLKALYENPDTLINIEFYNRAKEPKEIWVEPTCEGIQLDPETEYKIVTHDKFLRFEYDDEGRIVMYLQYSFGFKLYKRRYDELIPNTAEWSLVVDHSYNN